jgi:hypothetical protein
MRERERNGREGGREGKCVCEEIFFGANKKKSHERRTYAFFFPSLHIIRGGGGMVKKLKKKGTRERRRTPKKKSKKRSWKFPNKEFFLSFNYHWVLFRNFGKNKNKREDKE